MKINSLNEFTLFVVKISASCNLASRYTALNVKGTHFGLTQCMLHYLQAIEKKNNKKTSSQEWEELNLEIDALVKNLYPTFYDELEYIVVNEVENDSSNQKIFDNLKEAKKVNIRIESGEYDIKDLSKLNNLYLELGANLKGKNIEKRVSKRKIIFNQLISFWKKQGAGLKNLILSLLATVGFAFTDLYKVLETPIFTWKVQAVLFGVIVYIFLNYFKPENWRRRFSAGLVAFGTIPILSELLLHIEFIKEKEVLNMTLKSVSEIDIGLSLGLFFVASICLILDYFDRKNNMEN